MLTKTERIEMLEDARDLLYQAIEAIEQAVRGSHVRAGAEAYVLPTLKMCASKEHEYLGSQPYNIDKLVSAFEGDDEEEEN